MGAPRDEWGAGRFSDVQVQVRLSHSFWMGAHEVTVEQWKQEGFREPVRDVLDGREDCRAPQCPVTNINLFDALTFANRYSERRGLQPCYELEVCTGSVGAGPKCRAPSEDEQFVCNSPDESLNCKGIRATTATVYACSGYRLPTEAEWEYAARAGTLTAYYTGKILPERELGRCQPDPNLLPIAWYCANSSGQAHPVGLKKANALGLYDMLGNVREWTTDLFNGLGYGQGPLEDPVGSLLRSQGGPDLMPDVATDGQNGREHGFVTRGGSHNLPSSVTTVDDRTGAMLPERGSSSVGLRLVRTILP